MRVLPPAAPAGRGPLHRKGDEGRAREPAPAVPVGLVRPSRAGPSLRNSGRSLNEAAQGTSVRTPGGRVQALVAPQSTGEAHMRVLRFARFGVGLLSLLTQAIAQDKAVTTVRLVVSKTSVKSFDRESRAAFACSDGCVLVGRRHRRDENGPTDYREATLATVPKLVDGKNITIHFAQAHNIQKESRHEWFRSPSGHVITGREHSGDENGPTTYQTSVVKVGGIECRVVDREEESAVRRESEDYWHDAPEGTVMTGRSHTGDENGPTKYEWGRLEVDVPKAWLAGEAAPKAVEESAGRTRGGEEPSPREPEAKAPPSPREVEAKTPPATKGDDGRVPPWVLAGIALLAAGGGAAAWLGLLSGKKRSNG
jgi:hypothetical protein